MFVSAAQCVFVNRLLQSLPTTAPTVDLSSVALLGATELREAYSGAALQGIVEAYMIGIRDAFAFGIAVAGSAFIASWCVPFKSIKHGRSKPVGGMDA